MSETRTGAVTLETAAVTDRGLNEKRPHNEDSYLLDAERRIFAVADGVGGAHAGEVASRTAVEILEEAFRHQKSGDDVEDLMEIAIQRANASIFQMSREQQKFSMMATTIVALHLDGRRATVGHVGDSRLYSLAPGGRIKRETEDHSVVEEEVKAGRMTREQAANHPSRNVISRALGAEQSVEVDLRTFDVEEGTLFLLCSDGITRHLPDREIESLLRERDTLEAACEEMKRLCFERGAEDNLTAVAVRVGARAARPAGGARADEDPTLANARSARAAGAGANAQRNVVTVTPAAAGLLADADDRPKPATRPSRIAGEVADPDERKGEAAKVAEVQAVESEVVHDPSPVGRAGGWFMTLLLLLVVGAAAFYGGLRYQQNRAAGLLGESNLSAPPTPAPTPLDGYAEYVRLREQVDAAPALEVSRLAGENGGRPLDSASPEFLTLYGRALLLAGRDREAVEAFRAANRRIDGATVPVRDAVRVDARLGLAAAALRGTDDFVKQEAAQSLSGVIQGAQPTFTAPGTQPGGAQPQGTAAPHVQSPTP
jgi:serine/threonine protein phosphatase PrpC